MPRRPDIQWNAAQRERLESSVRYYNHQIDYYTKHHPEWAEHMPAKTSVEEKMEEIKSNRDLKFYTDSIDRMRHQIGALIPRTTAGGTKTTQWELREANVIEDREMQHLKRQVEEYDKLNDNIPATERGTMGQQQRQNLKRKRKNFETMRPKDFKKWLAHQKKSGRAYWKEEAAEDYKQIYLDMIERFLGRTAEGKALKRLIESLDAETIYKYYKEDDLMSISFTSDPIAANEIATAALMQWQYTLQANDVEYDPYVSEPQEGDEDELDADDEETHGMWNEY